MDVRTRAIDRLQKVCSELAELDTELKECDIDANAVGIFRRTLDQMHKTASTLQQGMERSRLSPDGQSLLALLIEERMRRASQLNTDISKDFEAGQIRTDQDGLSVYLLALNQIMQQRDLMFGSRKA